MTTHAVTAQAAHATLEDLGYQSCDKHGKVYWWLGNVACRKCDPPQSWESRQKTSRSVPLSATRTNQRDRKLTSEQVIEARRLWYVEGWTSAQLSKMFGLANSTMYHIAIGTKYQDVPMPPPEVRAGRAAKRASLKTHCNRGHNLAEVGQNQNRMCKACMKMYNDRRYEKP